MKTMNMFAHTYCWTIGDWSGDGHSETRVINFTTNTEIDTIRKWYIEGCEAAKIGFHESESAIQHQVKIKNPKELYCITYDGVSVSYDGLASIVRILLDAGIGGVGYTFVEDTFGHLSIPTVDEIDDVGISEELRDELETILDAKVYVGLIMEMISRFVYDDFEWHLLEDSPVVSVNGFWNKTLNLGIGYELFME